ncbi:MAG TPA: rhodanese-like domain-containing protein [Silvibacterium sp.]|nr:rhodanese-like domain-containing protein [Silvibacterium sp.]
MLSGMLAYEVSNQELTELLGSNVEPGCILLDVREPWEYEEAHIEGSVSMPMGDVPSRALQELDPEAHVIAICHHGVRSMSVTAWLRDQGFEKAQSLRGGIDAWSAQIDPSIPRY